MTFSKKKGDFRAFKLFVVIFILFWAGIFAFGVWQQSRPEAPIAPDWAAINAWPDAEAAQTEARPDPNRQITVIVLDDSGSMGNDIGAAKTAVQQAIATMNEFDRVAVIGLNFGLIQPFSDVVDAREHITTPLARVQSQGTTPLARSVTIAADLLEAEAASARSFGTYRIIVTTDGQADEPDALTSVIEEIARNTPIQLSTIGIGVGRGHVLRREDLGSFVNVNNVDALAEALNAAVAESADFTAITSFEGE